MGWNQTSQTEVDAETIRYRTTQNGQPAELDLLDQTRLPAALTRLVCTTIDQTHDAIVRLVVRGAPAIGIAAAYGVTLAPVNGLAIDEARRAYLHAIDHLATSRPTAVNLFWALDRMRAIVQSERHSSVEQLRDALVNEAVRIHDDDREMCRSIGRNGAPLLAACRRVMTHCNAGSLATSMWGTALAPIYHLHAAGHTLQVFADETRPLLQGARLTAWELHQAGIPVTVCTDSMSGSLMLRGQVDAVIVGADRIAANGDAANKIGTYPLAVLAKYHGIPFYVAAPTNTFDPKLASGDLIPIEQRCGDEVSFPCGIDAPRQTPVGVEVVNPAFDVTPAALITAIVTQRGVIESPTTDKVREHLLADPKSA